MNTLASTDYQNNPGTWVQSPPPSPHQIGMADDQNLSSLRHAWLLIRRSLRQMVIVGVLGAVGGYLVTLPQTEIYRAHATLEIQSLNENFLNFNDLNTTKSSAGSSYPEMLTQARILESQAMLDRVAAKLATRYPGERYPYPDRLASLKRLFRRDHAPDSAEKTGMLRAAAVSASVKAGMSTRIIEIAAESPNGELARDFVNTWAEEFANGAVESRWETIQRTEGFLTRQIQDLRAKLERSEGELQSYANSEGLLFNSGTNGETLAEERLRQIQEEFSKVQAERMSRQALLESMKGVAGQPAPGMILDQSLSDIRNKLVELSRERAELSTSMTADHYKVQRVQAQINELQDAFEKQRSAVLARINTEFSTAQRRQSLVEESYRDQTKQVASQNSRAVHYNILKRDVDTNRQIYEAMLKQVKEAGVASAMQASGIRILDSAQAPLVPSSPHRAMSACFGMAIGFLGVLGFTLLTQREGRKLTRSGDAQAWLGIPELGEIPLSGMETLLTLASSARTQISMPAKAVGIEAWDDQFSPTVEAFRATLTSIAFTNRNIGVPQVLVVSSPEPGDGKTTTVCNLAIAAAESNQRVLLIDADLRRPRGHEFFGLSNKFGLANILHSDQPIQQTSLSQLCSGTTRSRLCMLPAGWAANAGATLLYSPRLAELISRFRTEFDIILIDTPPILALADARIIGRFADAVILVIAAGRTTEYSAALAKQRLDQDRTPILGTVLNGIAAQKDAGYYYTTREESTADQGAA